jgi:hypothetical protein
VIGVIRGCLPIEKGQKTPPNNNILLLLNNFRRG